MRQPLIKNYDELDECYFHPSRKYASEEIKFIARNAMLLLWDMDGISVQGVHFSKSDIRYRMLNEMSCDDLDRAITEASAKNWNIKFVDFLVMILWHVLYGERFVEIQIEQYRGRDSA